MASREELMEALDAIETGDVPHQGEPGHLAELAGVRPVSGCAAAADGGT